MQSGIFWTQSSGKDLISNRGLRELRAVLDGYFRYNGSSVDILSLKPSLYAGLETGIIALSKEVNDDTIEPTFFYSFKNKEFLKLETLNDFISYMRELGYEDISWSNVLLTCGELLTSKDRSYGCLASYDWSGLDKSRLLCFVKTWNFEKVSKRNYVGSPNLVVVQLLDENLQPLLSDNKEQACFVKIVISAVNFTSKDTDLSRFSGGLNGIEFVESCYFKRPYFDLGCGAAKVEDSKAELPVAWRSECGLKTNDSPMQIWFTSAAKDLELAFESANQCILKSASFFNAVFGIPVGDFFDRHISGNTILDKRNNIAAELDHYSELAKLAMEGKLARPTGDSQTVSLESDQQLFIESLGSDIKEIYYTLIKNNAGSNLPVLYQKYTNMKCLKPQTKNVKFVVPMDGFLVFVKDDDGTSVWFTAKDPDNMLTLLGEHKSKQAKKAALAEEDKFVCSLPHKYDLSSIQLQRETSNKEDIRIAFVSNKKEESITTYADDFSALNVNDNYVLVEANDILLFPDIGPVKVDVKKKVLDLQNSITANINLACFLVSKRLASASQEIHYQYNRYLHNLELYMQHARSGGEVGAPRVDNVFYRFITKNEEPDCDVFEHSVYEVWMNVDNSFLDSFTSLLTAYKGSAGMGKNGSNQALVNIIKKTNNRTLRVSYAPAVSVQLVSGKAKISFSNDELLYRDYMQNMCGNILYSPFAAPNMFKAIELIYASNGIDTTTLKTFKPTNLNISQAVVKEMSNIYQLEATAVQGNPDSLLDSTTKFRDSIVNTLGLAYPLPIGSFNMPDRSYHFIGHNFVSADRQGSKFNKPLCLPLWCCYTSREAGGRSVPIFEWCFSLKPGALNPYDGAVWFGGSGYKLYLNGGLLVKSYKFGDLEFDTLDEFAMYIDKEVNNG
jgi:hypothetical protein